MRGMTGVRTEVAVHGRGHDQELHQMRMYPLTHLLEKGNLLGWSLQIGDVRDADAPLERRGPEVDCEVAKNASILDCP